MLTSFSKLFMEQNTHFSKSQCCHSHFVATSKIEIFQKLKVEKYDQKLERI